MPADLAVIGLGHLGLPLAQAAVGAGIHTVGYDTDPRPFTELSAGRTPVEGSLSASDIRRMVAGGFRPTADPAELGRVRTAAICAPTPLGPDRMLDLGAVTDAARALAARLRPHTTVLVESAVPPGTTENVVRPLLEEGSGLRAGRDFHLAHSPAASTRAAAPTSTPTPRRSSAASPPRAPSRQPPSTDGSPTRSYGPGGRARRR